MNWSRTKLIFIFTFLVLDFFLGIQLYQKAKDAEQVQSLPNGANSAEQRLKDNEIALPDDLPDIDKASFIKGKPQTFVNKKGDLHADLKSFQGNDSKPKQTLKIRSEGNQLFSKLKKPFSIQTSGDFETFQEKLGTFRKRYVYKGEKYRFWREVDNRNRLIFVQTYKDRPVFSKEKNQAGYLRLNKEDEAITSYSQTLFTFDRYRKDKDILAPKEAVKNLLDDNDLSFGDTVTQIELSYVNLTEESLGEFKVFIPTWHIRVQLANDAGYKEYFVNALTGQIQILNEQDSDTG